MKLKQVEVTDILVERWWSFNVYTVLGAYYQCKAVVLATGTYLKGRIYIGELNYYSGPNGLAPSNELSESLKDLGIELRKFKTGTPARIHSGYYKFTKWKFNQEMKK